MRAGCAALIVLALLPLAACGGGDGAQTAEPIAQLEPDVLPTRLLGLTVRREDMSEPLEQVARSYAEAVGLFGLRDEADVLQATLQVTRLNEDADVDDDGFRSQLLAQIGGSLPREVRVGGAQVYLARGTRQALSVWFRGRVLFVLATREQYETPRALLREALELRP